MLVNQIRRCIQGGTHHDEEGVSARYAKWVPYLKFNNLKYADDTTLTAESKEELKNLLMKVKEESEKAGLKLNI